MVVLLLGIWFLSGCTTSNNIEFPVVENNVAYSKVASLSFVNANEKYLMEVMNHNLHYCGALRKLIKVHQSR